MLYSSNEVGDFEFGYYPKIFQGLVLSLQETKSILQSSFRLSLQSPSRPRAKAEQLSTNKKSIFSREA